MIVNGGRLSLADQIHFSDILNDPVVDLRNLTWFHNVYTYFLISRIFNHDAIFKFLLCRSQGMFAWLDLNRLLKNRSVTLRVLDRKLAGQESMENLTDEDLDTSLFVRHIDFSKMDRSEKIRALQEWLEFSCHGKKGESQDTYL